MVPLISPSMTWRDAAWRMCSQRAARARREAHANFDVSTLPSGVYFVRLSAPGKTTARKLVVTH
jgi:hypothetical protein